MTAAEHGTFPLIGGPVDGCQVPRLPGAVEVEVPYHDGYVLRLAVYAYDSGSGELRYLKDRSA